MERPKLDFARIKREVPIADVARRYGFELKPGGKAGWLHGTCKLPTHQSKESKTSFAVNVNENYWICYSNSCRANRGNKRGGDVLMFVHWMDNLEPYDAAAKLAEWFHVNGNGNGGQPKPQLVQGAIVNNQKSDCKQEPEGIVNKPLAFAGFKNVDYAHEYLRKRGISPETAQEFGVGYFAGKSSVIKDPYRIVIPIHNGSGELVAYVGRSLDPQEKDKYHFPAGFHKSAELFNLHRVGEQVRALTVVEGFFGAMKVYQAGFHNVVALMGCTMSEVQEKLLEGFEKIILLLDPDESGRTATKELAERLVKHHFVYSVHLPDGKCPDCLSSKNIQSFLAPIA